MPLTFYLSNRVFLFVCVIHLSLMRPRAIQLNHNGFKIVTGYVHIISLAVIHSDFLFFCSDRICRYWWFTFVIVAHKWPVYYLNESICPPKHHTCAHWYDFSRVMFFTTKKHISVRQRMVLNALVANVCIIFCSGGQQTVSCTCPTLLFCCTGSVRQIYATVKNKAIVAWGNAINSREKTLNSIPNLNLKTSSVNLTLKS